MPPRHEVLVDLVNLFPREAIVRLLRALEVRYVLLHRDYYPADVWARLQTGVEMITGLTWAWQAEGVAVVQVEGTELPAQIVRETLTIPPTIRPGETFAPLLVLEVASGQVVLPGTRAQGTIVWQRDGRLVHRATWSETLPFLVGAQTAVLLPTAAPVARGDYQVTVLVTAPLALTEVATVQVSEALPAFQPLPVQLQEVELMCAEETLTVMLGWQAWGWLDQPQTVYLHLVDETGEKVGQVDQLLEPPPSTWLPTLPVTTTHPLVLPAGQEVDRLTLQVGLYRWDDQAGGIVPALFFGPDSYLTDVVERSPASSPRCRSAS